jgi:hypothetical protein
VATHAELGNSRRQLGSDWKGRFLGFDRFSQLFFCVIKEHVYGILFQSCVGV